MQMLELIIDYCFLLSAATAYPKISLEIKSEKRRLEQMQAENYKDLQIWSSCRAPLLKK